MNRFLTAFVTFLIISLSYLAVAQIPNTLNYQGRLTDEQGKPVADNLYRVTVRIYQAATGGTPVYEETIKAIQTTSGYFNIIIGKDQPLNLPFDVPYWMTITVGSGTETTTRTELTAVPYALNAKTAEGLSGTATGYVKSINALAGDIILVGSGGTTLNKNGQTITINSSGGGGAREIKDLRDGKADATSVFLGDSAGFKDEGNNLNTAVGIKVLYSNTTGSNNTASGVVALYSNTTGSNNTAYGVRALVNNTTGSNNVAIGNGALYNGNKSDIVAIGDSALFNNGLGSRSYEGRCNTAVGSKALFSNTTGSDNTANGFEALFLNTNGTRNTANGTFALYMNTTGNSNIANGSAALYTNTTGNSNTANGIQALYFNTTGNSNTANGAGALENNTTGSYNTANGYVALYKNTTGTENTANGHESLLSNKTGNKNTADGDSALATNYTGSYNSAVGANSDVGAADQGNSTALGCGAISDASNKVRVGNIWVTSIGGQVGWTSYSDGRFKRNVNDDVPGLAFITKLRPVTYNWDTKLMEQTIYKGRNTGEWKEKYDIEKMKFSGFIAQEVEAAANSVGFDFSGIDTPANKDGIYGLRYAEFVVPLVKAVQEQQVIIGQQQETIELLTRRLEALEAKVNGK